MTEQPPGPPWGGYPPQPPGSYPPPSPSGYPPPGYPPPGYPPPGYPPQAPSGHVEIPGVGVVGVASIGQRFLARLIDGVLLGIVDLVLILVFLPDVFSTTHAVTDSSGPTVAVPSTYGIVTQLAISAMTMALGLLYEGVLIGVWGATLGKMALHIKVVDSNTGALIGLGRGFVRYLIFVLGNLACGVGIIVVYLSVLFDNSGRNQGWQDKAAHDLVIRPAR